MALAGASTNSNSTDVAVYLLWMRSSNLNRLAQSYHVDMKDCLTLLDCFFMNSGGLTMYKEAMTSTDSPNWQLDVMRDELHRGKQ